MDIPKLFAQYASDDILIWEQIINCNIEHSVFGTGKIEKVYKKGRSIYIECIFHTTYKIFISESFYKDAFINIEIPSSFMVILLNFHKKSELITISDELASQGIWDIKAIETNKSIIEIDPICLDAYIRLARCYMAISSIQLAEETFEKVLCLDKGNRIAINALRQIQNDRKSNYSDRFNTLMNTANQYFDNQNDHGLINIGNELALLLSKSITVQGGLPKLCKQIVSAHLTLGNINDALNWINKISSKDKNIQGIIDQLLEIKRTNSSCIIEDIDNPYTLNRLASLHKSLFAYRKAISIYETSLHLDNKNIFTFNGLGGNYKELGQYDKAIDYYDKAYNIQSNIVSLNGMGAAYRAKKRPADAIKKYKEVLTNNPLDVYANNGIGAVYFDLGRYDLGTPHFMIAANEEHLFGLFYEYKANNQLKTALECLKLILQKSPGNPKAISLLKRYS